MCSHFAYVEFSHRLSKSKQYLQANQASFLNKTLQNPLFKMENSCSRLEISKYRAELKALHARSLKVEALDLEMRADTLTHQSVQDTVKVSGIQTRCRLNLATGTPSISVSSQVEHGRHTVQSVAHANRYLLKKYILNKGNQKKIGIIRANVV